MTILKSQLLDKLPWVDHGFGTRHAAIDREKMASLKQIHSNLSLVAEKTGRIGEADALITRVPDLAVSIRTADCLPILLADSKTHAVAAIHAGWRGTATKIVSETLNRMHREFSSEPSDVYAVIGPGIGKCCYEVGPEVASQFGFEGKVHLDLAEENRRQLITAGVPADQIDSIAACTSCDSDRFFSWRRDHDAAGRMISYIRAHSDKVGL